ncbi:hypothetical protein GCM10010251_97230 [Streptomyces aurantiogriseus]|uniref:Uncharacterized protein n=1 Tax=Streptomyces aurantiogriseus TaxID=66870 RepID=A0A918FPP4_9ACTN|nr:hypothetical protein GCM10010251_97230 [Streptomyces aurantiogriseus]
MSFKRRNDRGPGTMPGHGVGELAADRESEQGGKLGKDGVHVLDCAEAPPVGQDGAVAADFAADRRWASAQLRGDRPDGGLLQ